MSSANSANGLVEQGFHLSSIDFDRVRQLIYRHAGISLSPAKRQMVCSRLGRRLRALGLESFGSYLDLLESRDAAEWEAFTNALTTNLTSFFREGHHFPVLAEHLAAQPRTGPLTIWCSACSTGEEAYSIAMTAADLFDSLQPPVRILASDVDTNVLAAASAGVYPDDALDRLSPQQRRKYFLRGSGGASGLVKARPELQALISFRQINLLHERWPVRSSMDAIFCRNVMIYFDKPTQHAILSRFAPLLKPDGLLFAGHSESLHHAADLFRLRGKTVYDLAPGWKDRNAK